MASSNVLTQVCDSNIQLEQVAVAIAGDDYEQGDELFHSCLSLPAIRDVRDHEHNRSQTKRARSRQHKLEARKVKVAPADIPDPGTWKKGKRTRGLKRPTLKWEPEETYDLEPIPIDFEDFMTPSRPVDWSHVTSWKASYPDYDYMPQVQEGSPELTSSPLHTPALSACDNPLSHSDSSSAASSHDPVAILPSSVPQEPHFFDALNVIDDSGSCYASTCEWYGCYNYQGDLSDSNPELAFPNRDLRAFEYSRSQRKDKENRSKPKQHPRRTRARWGIPKMEHAGRKPVGEKRFRKQVAGIEADFNMLPPVQKRVARKETARVILPLIQPTPIVEVSPALNPDVGPTDILYSKTLTSHDFAPLLFPVTDFAPESISLARDIRAFEYSRSHRKDRENRSNTKCYRSPGERKRWGIPKLREMGKKPKGQKLFRKHISGIETELPFKRLYDEVDDIPVDLSLSSVLQEEEGQVYEPFNLSEVPMLKEKVKKGKEPGFEVIPEVRAVIAMDDDSVSEMDEDMNSDDWECVWDDDLLD